MDSCADCIYSEYKPSNEFHFGANETDWYCQYHEKWLHSCSGKCRDFISK